jgi:hypothetical protein
MPRLGDAGSDDVEFIRRGQRRRRDLAGSAAAKAAWSRNIHNGASARLGPGRDRANCGGKSAARARRVAPTLRTRRHEEQGLPRRPETSGPAEPGDEVRSLSAAAPAAATGTFTAATAAAAGTAGEAADITAAATAAAAGTAAATATATACGLGQD